MSDQFAPVIGEAEFEELRRRTPPPVVLEVRRSELEAEVHVPGAVPIYLDTELQGVGGGPRGSRPLPEGSDLRKSLQRWGVGDGGAVVYTTDGLAIAARAWLVLRLAGVEVSVLDVGNPSRADDGVRAEVSSVEAADLGAFVDEGLLLDARGAESYSGSHIPGAVSAPASDLLDADGHLLSSDALRRHFESHGIGSKVASYCGGGVAASLEALALASVGIPSSIYVASWSGWTASREENR